MKWLGKLFKKKKKTYGEQENLRLCIIDENAKLLHDNLGVTEERAEKLTKLCIDSYQNNDLLYKCLDDVVKGCVHINEVVFATMVLHKIIERYNNKDRLDNLLKNMFGNG